jgi:hypothetical protein
MATKKITFDPDAGVPYGSNLTLYGGANFKASFTVVDTSNAAFDFSGAGTTWTGSSQMQKSVGVGATTIPAGTFTVGFTSAAGGKFDLTMTSAATTSFSEGRYEYNVLVSSGTTTYNIINGNILVYQGISSAPS